MSSPILKFLPDAIVAQIAERAGARDGDLLFFGAGDAKIVDASLGALRVEIARPELAQKAACFARFGLSIFRFSKPTTKARSRLAIILSPPRPTRNLSPPIRARRGRALTIWSSTESKSAAARSAFTNRKRN